MASLFAAEDESAVRELVARFPEELLLGDEVAGVLALYHHAAMASPVLQAIIESLRQTLTVLRCRECSGDDLSVTDVLTAALAARGATALSVWPAPDAARRTGEGHTELVEVWARALLFAPSARERYRLACAFPEFVTPGTVKQVEAGARGRDGSVPRAMGAAVRDVTAFLSAPESVGVPGTVVPGEPMGIRAEFRENEFDWHMTTLFIDTPCWDRRKLILEHAAEGRLLGAGVTTILDEFLTTLGPDHPHAARVRSAQAMIDAVRAHGISAFDGPKPPTGVVGLLAVPGGLPRSERIASARQVLCALDTDSAPRLWVNSAFALMDDLHNEARASGNARLLEEGVFWGLSAGVVVASLPGSDLLPHLLRRLGEFAMARLRGDPVANSEAAVSLLTRAYKRFGEEAADTAASARVAGVIAGAYLTDLGGITALNRERGVAYARSAVEAFRLLGDRGAELTARVTLSRALRSRRFGERTENLEVALAVLEDGLALDVPEPDAKALPAKPRDDEDAHPLLHVHLEAAQVLALRGGPDDLAAVRRHLAVYEATGPAAPASRANVSSILGTALGKAAERLGDTGEEAEALLGAAEAAYREVLDVMGGTQDAAMYRIGAGNLGSVLFRNRRWEECVEILGKVVDASTHLESRTWTEQGSRKVLVDLRQVHERLAYALLRLGRPDEALTVLDEGRSRLTRRGVLARGTAEARRRLPQVRLDPEAARGAVPAGGAVIVPLVTRQGTAVYVMTGDPDEPWYGEVLEFPEVTARTMALLISGDHGSDGGGGDGGSDGEGAGAGSGDSAALGWHPTYLALLTAIGGDGPKDEAWGAWSRTVEEVPRALWDAFLGKVQAHLESRGLREGAPVTVVPDASLNSLPLGAASRVTESGVRHWLDDVTLSFAPSLADVVRARVADTEAAPQTGTATASPVTSDPVRPTRIVAVADPLGDLPMAASEVDAIRRLADGAEVVVLAGSDATGAALEAAVPGATHVHLSCHGKYDYTDALSSYVLLAGREAYTARRIGRNLDLRGVDVVTLSACETGIVDQDETPNDLLGLPGACLAAGARHVVSSLWAVASGPTARLMELFYGHLLEPGATVAGALRAAQRQLRDSGLSDPVFWGAFTVFGPCEGQADANGTE